MGIRMAFRSESSSPAAELKASWWESSFAVHIKELKTREFGVCFEEKHDVVILLVTRVLERVS